jgi:hypothetical protein
MKRFIDQHPSEPNKIAALLLIGTAALGGCTAKYEIPEVSDDEVVCTDATIETNALNATKDGLRLLQTKIIEMQAIGELPNDFGIDNINALNISWQANEMLTKNETGPSDPYVYAGETFELCVGKNGNISALRVLNNTSHIK